MNNVFKSIGVSETAIREQNDYYATDPKAMHKLLEHESFNEYIWEPACGEGNLSEVLKEYGYQVFSTDLIDRGYQDKQMDFLSDSFKFNGDIITNPPFKYVSEFIIKSLASIPNGNKVAMFLKINHLTGIKRYNEIYSKYPPLKVYVFSKNYGCSKNNKPDGFKNNAMDFIWCIWQKGVVGPTELKWIK